MEKDKKLFKPANEKQREFLYSKKRYVLLSGAVAAGKSLLGLQKGVMLNMFYPGNRGLVCRKESVSLKQSTLRTLFEQVMPVEWIVNYNKQEGVLIHRTPIDGVYSTIVFGGLDKRADQTYPTKIGSTEYGWIFVDEGTEIDLGDWSMLSTRLRYKIPRYSDERNNNLPRQIFTATNPDSPNHWMYKFFFIDRDDNRQAVLTTPYDNPYLSEEYLKSLERSLVGVTKERLLYGKWVQAEGIIYDTFDIRKHVVPQSKLLFKVNNDGSHSFDPKLYKAVYFGADSNFPLPRAALIIGIHGDNKVDVLDEFYRERSPIEELGKWLTDWSEKLGRGIIGFHDPSGASDIATLNKFKGVICEKANNEVIAGISEVSRHFTNDLIRINESCVNLIKEINSYKWKKDGVPDKKDDHSCDSLRYILNSIKKKQTPDRSRGRPIFF